MSGQVLYLVLRVSGYWQALMLMDVPGFLLGHRESGHLYFSKEHFQIHVWRKELKLQGLAWKLKNLLFISLGTMHSLFWVLQCAERVLSKPPCFGGTSDTLPAFSLLKFFPTPRSVNTAWDTCHILSSYLFLVNMRRSSREGFEARWSCNPFAFFSLFYSWSEANKPACEKGISCVTKQLAGGSWQSIGIREEIDFLLYKHLRIRL